MYVNTKKPRKVVQQQPMVVAQIPRPIKRARSTYSMADQMGATAGFSGAPEKKNVDVSFTAASVAATTWSIPVLISGIAQGTSSTTRVGRKVTLKSLLCRWAGGVNSAAAGWRVLVVYDHAPNGALPLITDILSVNNINGVNNLANNDRFLILKDFYPQTMIPLVSSSIAESFYIKFPGGGLQQNYFDSATGLITDISTGAIYVALCASLTGASTNFVTRIRFTDV